MAAPTQALPPWLSYTTITLPQTTETSVVFLPLTYFGPSIPLDSDWTYGGLSSPVSTTSTTSQISITSTTSAIPSTSSAATPNSTSSLPSSSSSSTSFTSPTFSPSALPTTASAASPLTRAQLIGVIIGSILGALVLFLLLLLLCIRIRHRRNGTDAATATATSGTRTRTKFTLFPTRRTRRRTRFTMLTPPVAGDTDADADEVLDDWLIVGSPTSPQSPPAEPGHGAGEADPFLTRALALAGGAERLPNPHSANNSGSGSGAGNGNGNSGGTTSGSGSSRGTHATTSSGTNVSGYGVLLAHPTLSLPDREALGLPPGAASPSSPASAAYNNGSGNGGTGASALPRRILTPAQMAVLVEEDDMERVLPRASGSGERIGRGLGGVLEGEEGELEEGVDEGEEGEVVHARRVALAAPLSFPHSATNSFSLSPSISFPSPILLFVLPPSFLSFFTHFLPSSFLLPPPFLYAVPNPYFPLSSFTAASIFSLFPLISFGRIDHFPFFHLPSLHFPLSYPTAPSILFHRLLYLLSLFLVIPSHFLRHLDHICPLFHLLSPPPCAHKHQLTHPPLPAGKGKETETEARRSWIPRFSWLLNRDSWRNSRGSHNSRGSRGSRDVEEEGGLLLFDAGAGGHSPTGSISSPPVSPAGGAGAGGSGVGASGSGSGSGVGASASGSGAATMREFGARPLLPFLARRPSAANNTSSRPISGVSALSSDGTGGTGGSGSGRSGGTVFTDARETLSTRGSRAALGGGSAQGSATALGQGQAQAQGQALDPLDLPAPAPLAAFASSSQHSLHHAASVRSQASLAHSLHGSASLAHSHSTSAASASLSHSTSQQNATLVGSASNTTLGTVATPATGHAPLKPERVYAHGQNPAYPHAPPGLGYPYAYSGTAANNSGNNNTVGSTNTGGPGQGQGQGWDAAGLELGFARPASHSKLGTFGSKNAAVVPAAFGAPGIRVVGAPASSVGSPLGGGGGSGGGAPHLSLDLDDAPPGAEGGWRLLGGSAHSLLGSQSSREGDRDRDGGPGRRGTFGIGVTGAAQYHHSPEHSSERGSLHSRVGGSSSVNSSSLSSRSHAQLPSGATTSHSLYPSSGSGSHSHSHSGNSHSNSNSSARARALAHAGSVEGPMSPAVSAFGHRARGAGAENSGSSGSGGPGHGHGHGKQETSSGSGERSRSPRSPTSPLLAPWAGGLDPDWRPT
ncbi:hypothetical protein B0H11DRAFT_2220254 [Mycena galericulata]|nr:hypothetical protein B0H11DRAFT_2220254 [Mycena galericulata]